jgi:hypothetical protein
MTSNANLDGQIIHFDRQREQSSEIDGAELLFEICDFLGRFVCYPNEHAQIAHTLWIAHTHMMDAWERTPRLALLSPEPQSGKTRALEVSELLVPNAVETVNMSSAYLFRRIGADIGVPTLLMDEVDALFNGKSQVAEEIRGVTQCRLSTRRNGRTLCDRGEDDRDCGISIVLCRCACRTWLVARHAYGPEHHYSNAKTRPAGKS